VRWPYQSKPFLENAFSEEAARRENLRELGWGESAGIFRRRIPALTRVTAALKMTARNGPTAQSEFSNEFYNQARRYS
jgi:hypothetical protein